MSDLASMKTYIIQNKLLEINEAAYQYAGASSAYEEDAILRKWQEIGDSDFTPVMLKQDSAEIFIVKIQGKVIVAFPGTDSSQFQDVLADLNVRPFSIPLLDMKVPTSTWERVARLFELVRQLKGLDLTNPLLNVLFTGHSLGGVMAANAAIYRTHVNGSWGDSTLMAVTFAAFATTYGDSSVLKNRLICVRNENDIVPEYPWRYKFHSNNDGMPLFLGKDKTLRNKIPWWRKFKSFFRGSYLQWPPKPITRFLLNEHSLSTYATRLYESN